MARLRTEGVARLLTSVLMDDMSVFSRAVFCLFLESLGVKWCVRIFRTELSVWCRRRMAQPPTVPTVRLSGVGQRLMGGMPSCSLQPQITLLGRRNFKLSEKII